LKLFVLPLRRRSDWLDGTRAIEQRVLLPCENDQAKPDLFSRLARSTNCQRSLRTFRLSGALLDRGPDCYAQDVLELVALARLRCSACSGVFARTF
jgi:hypothetical protein